MQCRWLGAVVFQLQIESEVNLFFKTYFREHLDSKVKQNESFGKYYCSSDEKPCLSPFFFLFGEDWYILILLKFIGLSCVTPYKDFNFFL